MRHFATLTALALLSACGIASGEAVGNDQAPARRSYPLAGFERVELKGSDDVEIRRAAQFSVEALGSTRTLDALELRVENGVLQVGRKKGSQWSWSKDRGAKIVITMPKLVGAKLAGSGAMQADASGNSGDFAGSVTGSGDLRITGLNAAATSLNLAGSGNLQASGSTRSLTLALAGSGDLDSRALASDQLSAALTGSGDIDASTRGAASLSLTGSGDIRVTGTDQCQKRKIGSGDISCTR